MSSSESSHLCDTCKALPIKESLRNLLEALQHSCSTGNDERQEESFQQTWHTDLKIVAKSSAFCVLCKLVLKGLRDGRLQLVEATRNSGDWYEEPKDFDDDILSIPFYADNQLKLMFVARPFSDFERANSVNDGKSEEKKQVHALISVFCGGGTRGSWEGYGEVRSDLRISSQDGSNLSHYIFGHSIDSK